MAAPHILPLWEVLHVPTGLTEALIVVVAEPADPRPSTFPQRWAPTVPRSAFAAVHLTWPQPWPVDLARRIVREAAALGVGTGQIVLIGEGMHGHVALDLVVFGRCPGASAIMIDLPPGAIPIGPGDVRGSLRFIQNRQPDDADEQQFEAMIHTLRHAALDVRTIVLRDGPDPTSRALGTFLAELVAIAGRNRSGAARPLHDVTTSAA